MTLLWNCYCDSAVCSLRFLDFCTFCLLTQVYCINPPIYACLGCTPGRFKPRATCILHGRVCVCVRVRVGGWVCVCVCVGDLAGFNATSCRFPALWSPAEHVHNYATAIPNPSSLIALAFVAPLLKLLHDIPPDPTLTEFERSLIAFSQGRCPGSPRRGGSRADRFSAQPFAGSAVRRGLPGPSGLRVLWGFDGFGA